MNDRRLVPVSTAEYAGAEPSTASDGHSPGPAPPRRPYTPPRLERLGAWRALTLQQSIPIGPGGA